MNAVVTRMKDRARGFAAWHAVRAGFAIALVLATLGFAIDDRSGSAILRMIASCLAAGGAIASLASLADDDRRLARLTIRLARLARRDGAERGLACIERDAETIEGLLGSIEQRLLHRHPVSGLPTREPLFRAIGEARDAGAHGVLGIVHLPDFERLHTFDEAAAEHLLVTLVGRAAAMLGAQRLIAQIDRARLAIWYGGDITAAAARAQLDALGYALGGAIEVDGRELLPEIRVTSAAMPGDADTPAALLARALAFEVREPQAIAAGADVLDAARERYALEQDLRRSVHRGELELHYQPLIDAEAGRVCGAEALLRWRHPVHGLVPPTRFVPIMEGAGLADEIGSWVLNAACREARAFRAAGQNGLRIAVNISRRQLDGGDLPALIERTLARHSLDAQALEIELTETVATGDTERASALFRRLRALGLTIAIDDFGTGYSSLSTLRTLSFDKIKIDREFVTAVDRRRDSQAICRAILALGHGLGIRVLAEGVETAEEYGWLRMQGCGHFQGYYFARPLVSEDFQAFVADRRGLAALLDPSLPTRERLRA